MEIELFIYYVCICMDLWTFSNNTHFIIYHLVSSPGYFEHVRIRKCHCVLCIRV